MVVTLFKGPSHPVVIQTPIQLLGTNKEPVQPISNGRLMVPSTGSKEIAHLFLGGTLRCHRGRDRR